jgi:Tfp pilus assembly major pilin PilA
MIAARHIARSPAITHPWIQTVHWIHAPILRFNTPAAIPAVQSLVLKAQQTARGAQLQGYRVRSECRHNADRCSTHNAACGQPFERCNRSTKSAAQQIAVSSAVLTHKSECRDVTHGRTCSRASLSTVWCSKRNSRSCDSTLHGACGAGSS